MVLKVCHQCNSSTAKELTPIVKNLHKKLPNFPLLALRFHGNVYYL